MQEAQDYGTTAPPKISREVSVKSFDDHAHRDYYHCLSHQLNDRRLYKHAIPSFPRDIALDPHGPAAPDLELKLTVTLRLGYGE